MSCKYSSKKLYKCDGSIKKRIIISGGESPRSIHEGDDIRFKTDGFKASVDSW